VKKFGVQVMTDDRATVPTDWPWGKNWIQLYQLPEPFRSYFVQVQEFVENLLSGTNVWQPPSFFSEISWGMTGDVGLNSEAKATLTGKYAIALDAGAPIQLWDTFCRLLANPSVLSDIGEAPREPFVPQALMKFHPVWDPRRAEAIRAGSTKQAPLGNELRVDCLGFLIHKSLQFMYLHELAHILEGHVDYLAFQLANSVDELRGLEYRADARAAILALFLESLRGKPKDDDHLVLKEQFRLWGFAICTWFLLVEAFDQAASSGGTPFSSRYPVASVRSFLVNGTVAGSPPTYNNTFKRDKVLAAVTRGFEEAHKAWEDMGWGTYQYPTMADVNQAMTEISIWKGRLKPIAQDVGPGYPV
jgi:hypothetical protein